MASLFLNNILPRIKQFSASLDQVELFVDKPWAVIDEEFNKQKYIFRRNGVLIMSLNGQVSIGSWEYLPEVKCILLNRDSDKLLLNHNFLDSAVMILKKDGPKNEVLILANEVVIPDLDIVGYLQNILKVKGKEFRAQDHKETGKFSKAKNIEVIITPNGMQLEIVRSRSLLLGTSSNLLGSKILNNGTLINDGIIEIYKNDFYRIYKGEIIARMINESYKTPEGNLIIETDDSNDLSLGDAVYLNNVSAPDGKYKLGFFRQIKVKNGKIVEISRF